MYKMKLLFKNKKFIKTLIAVIILIAVVGILLGVYFNKKKTKIQVAKVKKGNVSEYYTAKGIIESSGKNSYEILKGTKVDQIFVNVGDGVKKGDMLATFDTSGCESLVKQKELEYNQALNQYNKVLRSVEAAKDRVTTLDNKIEKLQSTQENLKEKNGVSANASNKNISAEELKKILDTLSGGDSSLTDKEVQEILNDMTKNKQSIPSNYSLEDINNIMNSGSILENQLLNLGLQIDLLEAQRNTLQTTISQTYLDGYKTAVDATKKALKDIKSKKESLDKGWKAKTNGVVSEIQISEGQVFDGSKNESNANKENLVSMLQKVYNSNIDTNKILQDIVASKNSSSGVGMVINNFKDYYVKFSLGKYDAQKIKLGMKAKIYFLSNDYKGVVSYVGTVASSKSTNLSSLTGMTSTPNNKLPAKVTIENPDKKLVQGFDVSVKIKTREVKNVLTIPIECLMGTSDNSYVYIYNDKENSISKRNVKVGASSEDCYEIVSGLKKGEKVVMNLSEDSKKNEKFYVGD